MSPVSKILGKNNLDAASRKAIIRLNRFYLFLSSINEAMIRIHDKKPLLDEICMIAVKDGGFLYSRITLIEDTGEPFVISEYGPDMPAGSSRIRDERFNASARKVMETSEILVINDANELESLVPVGTDTPGSCRSIASFPIKNGGKLLGVLSLNSAEPGCFGEVEINLIRQVAGNINFVLHGMENEEKKNYAEKLLLDSQAQYADLYENSPDMFISVDPITTRIVRCNETLSRITGYSKTELTGKKLIELYHPDSHESFKRNLAIFKEKGAITNAEIKIVTKSGEIRNLLLSSSAVKDENGKIILSRSTWRDITEIKRHETLERRLWMILKESLNEIYIFNGTTLKFEFVNDGALKNLGYTSLEMSKMTPLDIKPGMTPERFREILEPLLNKSESKVVFETRNKRKDGSLYDIEMHLQYLEYEGDKVFLAVVLDITNEKRRKRIEQMRYNITRAVATTETTADLIATIHAELKIAVPADNFFIALYNENTGMLNALIETDETEKLESWPAEKTLSGLVIKKQRPLHLREHEIKQLAEDNIIEILGTPAKAWLGVPLIHEGKTKGVMVVQSYNDQDAYDDSSITTLEIVANGFSLYVKKKEAEVEAKKLSTAIAQSPIIVVITDLDGKIEYVNPEFTNVTGYTSGDVLGKRTSILKSGNKSMEEYKLLWDTILAGRDWHGEFLNKKKNNELYWEEAVISPVKDDKGVITNFVAIKEDITEKRRMVGELIQAKDDAEEMNRLKTNFLANMSHELRTPLNGILGFSEIVSEESTEPSIRDMGGMINKSGKRLLETLNLILDLSRIEAGRLEIKSEEVDILVLANEVINFYTLPAKEKGLYLNLVAQPGIGQFKSDGRLLTEILKNLIDNAVKFTRSGGVILEVTATGNELGMKVTDTGIGIPREEQSVIWEEFRQASEGLSRNFEGVGLGLTLTKKFIQKLGGSITCSSKTGEGTSFTVKLPVDFGAATGPLYPHRDSVPDRSGSEITPSNKPSILIVDDDLGSIKYLSFLISGSYEIETSMDGSSALEAIQRKKFDVILMDINLGKGMNGIEVTKKIREMPEYNDTPVIAITAFAMSGDREEFLEAGCSHYISKPFNKKEFLQLLTSIRL